MNNYVITGATSSTGQALAKMIAEDDRNKLVLISRSHSLELEELSKKRDTIKYFSGIDLLLNFEKQKGILDFIDDYFDSPFSLIHLAGNFWYHDNFLDVNTETAINMMNSHYGTLYSVCQSIIPIMKNKKGGKILTLSCNATDFHFPNMLPFTAAKAAVEAAVKCIAHEHAKDKIMANAIAISSLKTEANKKSKPYGDYEHYIALEKLSEVIIDFLQFNNLVNGSIINCFEYSKSYYDDGYFLRIKQK